MTNDVAALARVVRDESPNTLVLVDAVSSLGGIPVRFDEWGLDVCLASVQKGIALPPGITVFAVSPRALARCAKRPYRGAGFTLVAVKLLIIALLIAVASPPAATHALARAAMVRGQAPLLADDDKEPPSKP